MAFILPHSPDTAPLRHTPYFLAAHTPICHERTSVYRIVSTHPAIMGA